MSLEESKRKRDEAFKKAEDEFNAAKRKLEQQARKEDLHRENLKRTKVVLAELDSLSETAQRIKDLNGLLNTLPMLEEDEKELRNVFDALLAHGGRDHSHSCGSSIYTYYTMSLSYISSITGERVHLSGDFWSAKDCPLLSPHQLGILNKYNIKVRYAEGRSYYNGD